MGAVEASRTLGCRRETIFRLIQRGELPAIKFLGRWIILKEAVEELARTYRPMKGRPRGERGQVSRQNHEGG